MLGVVRMVGMVSMVSMVSMVGVFRMVGVGAVRTMGMDVPMSVHLAVNRVTGAEGDNGKGRDGSDGLFVHKGIRVRVSFGDRE
jgi:hypothetical protein